MIYGAYTALVYITPVIGGYLADRYLGQTYGWPYGFGAAGIGMLLGLLVFIWGKPLQPGCAPTKSANNP